jgi:hypothetical protein
VQQLVADLQEPEANMPRIQLVDAIFKAVDLGVDGVQKVEERVRDLVDEAMDEDSDRSADLVRRWSAAGSNAVPPGGVFRTVTRSSGVATKSIS